MSCTDHGCGLRLKGLIDAVKAVKPDLLVFYHTCGYAEPLIGDLIEAGVDVLNPVQPECMDFAKIHSEYGGAVSFHGTIGTQTTMPFGTPEDVRSAVFRNLDIAGPSAACLSRRRICSSRRCRRRMCWLTSRRATITQSRWIGLSELFYRQEKDGRLGI